MKIKDIRQYRTFYKTTRPVAPNLEEHFIGNYYIDKEKDEKKFGWFTMYHGDRDGFSTPEAGIENFLQSFLDMAKDGQAVYEFLQNAVDAGSTHYTMVWGKDEVDGNYYLLVANNGEMFTPNSIRSILNVGSSTKNVDSQTIGKFGIGFKLAHRLVGKDNGLQELINENSGPLLFSWKNYELDHLAAESIPIPTKILLTNNKKGEIEINDDYPWLFKILITCFPCLPENDLIAELPKMANGIEAKNNPFSRTEYNVLSRWVKNNKHILNKETYNKGALFFIKLGSGKESELAEINLKEGVKFALAILKETADTDAKKEKILHTVQLNNEEPITYPDLEYIKLTVNKETENDIYSYIRFGTQNYNDLSLEQKKKIKEEANIEALFGFRKYNEISNYFSGAPNFYLYFPLSEEVHNFNYILHSNAFYKGSSRTFLHKGSSKEDGINERLLKIIVKKIDNELSRLATSTELKDRQHFLHFYAALLTSAKSTNQDRLWIEEPYTNRINELLKKYIPIINPSILNDFTITDVPNNVFIMKTQIEIDTHSWAINNVNWFFWGNEAESAIQSSAFTKLGIKDFTIYNLLTTYDTISTHLNDWIGQDENRVKCLLSEIADLDTEVVKDSVFKKNLFNLKLLKFNNGELLSITEFQNKEKDGYFIIFNKLNDIKDLLLKLGLKYTNENFDEYNFNPKYFSFFANESQVKSYTILTKLFSQIVPDEKLLELNASEKYRIFEAFRTFNDSPGERMGELKLFQNNYNHPVCFKNLYSSSSITWLNKFCISTSEDNSAYKNYLLSKSEELYQGIVFPYWDQIANFIADNPSQAKEVLSYIMICYEKSTWIEKIKNLLNRHGLIIFQSKVIITNEIFYNAELSSFTDEIYKSIQIIALTYFGVHIPDKLLIPYIDKLPLSFISTTINPAIKNVSSTLDELNVLLLFCKSCNIDFFGINSIILTNGVYHIDSSSGRKQIATSNIEIIKYIDNYYPEEYQLIPEIFNTYKSKIELSDSKLVEHLIERFDESDLKQELDFIEVILTERYEDKKALLEKLTFTSLDASWIEVRQNELYIKLLKEVVEGNLTQEELANIHKKIAINKDNQEIIIGNIDSAHDSIEVSRGDKKIILSQSQILNLDNADNIKLIQSFHHEVKRRDFLIQSIANKLFKISNTGITNELVSRFKEKLIANQLENAHQLLFVLLSGKINKEEFKDYSVKSINGIWYLLEHELIIYSDENEKHISPSLLLDKSYDGLKSLLQLSDLEVFNYNDNEDDIISTRFLFVKGISPNILDGSDDINSKLNYLFEGWVNLPPVIKDYKRNQDWDNYLEISPNQYVLNGIHVEKEILPKVFISWYQNNKKKEDFFKAIGINIGDSPIEKIRKFLTGKSNINPNEIEIERFNETLLLNTINGLAGDFTNLNKMPIFFNEIQQSDQLLLIEKIINHLITKKIDNYPVLIYNTTESIKVLKSEELPVYKIDEILHGKLKTANGNRLNLLYSKFNILKQSPLMDSRIIDNFQDLEFERFFVMSGNQIEHDEPFYHSWKEENSIKLFKENDLIYDISIKINNENTIVGRVSDGDFYIKNEIDEIQEIYYVKSNSLEDLSSALLEEHEDLSDAINNLVNKRNKMLTSIYNTLNSAGKDDFNNEHLQALKAAFKEEDLKQERKSLLEEIKLNIKYSYSWFESYLNYLLTFSNEQDNTKQKTIRFQSLKRQIVENTLSSKYFLLCGSSSYVSDSIEEISDFSLSITTKSNNKYVVKVEGAQKRGQDLLIFCPNSLKKEVFENINNIIHIEIAFIPKMNLLKELKNAYANKNNIDEWEDINVTLPNLHFIYGPPGTGKTTTLCSMIIEGIKQNINAKFLLLTPTNKAADVLSKKLLKPSESPEDIIRIKLEELAKDDKSLTLTRIGKATDPELEALEETVYSDAINTNQLNYTNIIASTVHRLPYTNVLNENRDTDIKLFKLENHWDYVIFDEASMTNLPYLVFAILSIYKFNPNAKFIIAGDPKQIPPVVDVNDKDIEELDIQDENIYSMMKIRSFRKEEQPKRPDDTIDNLYKQFRSVKKIGQLFSDLSYDKLLIHDRDETKNLAKSLPEAFRKLINNNVTFINIPLNREDSIFKIKQLFYSSYHIYSAIFVVEIVKYLDSVLGDNENWTIGLIAPYKAQAVLLNKLIASFGISEKLKIYSDTVHGFQGDECDIVFFISNPNNYYFSGHPKCLLSKEYIYNVAISRAKDYLIILHPFEVIKNNPFINTIKASYSNHFENPVIRESSEFETILFSQKDYISENSYVTGHDSVNVFGQIEKKYFIKANDNAIDIQLRKLSN